MISSDNPSPKRIEYIDSIRGLAIFLVVWGHAIQYLDGEASFFTDPVFKFIYSFHMPLFFVISGFLFSSSLRKPAADFFKQKSLQLLLPSVVWALILGVIDYPILKDEPMDILKVLNPQSWHIWFLRELFISSALVYLAFGLVKKGWLAAMLCLLAVLIIPYFEIQRSLLPAFLAGMLLRRNYFKITGQARYLLPAVAVVFAVLLIFWETKYTLYFTTFPSVFHINGMSFNFQQFGLALYRIIIGIAGSVIMWLGIRMLYRDNRFLGLLARVGTLTMGIYIFQTLILEKIIPLFINLEGVPHVAYILVTFITAITVTLLTGWLTLVTNKNRYTGLIFLGTVPRKK